MKVYGITNCNTVKKALDWLRENKVVYEFHDFKKLGVTADKLAEWNSKAGYEKVMNKQGLTYRGLDAETKASITGSAPALKILQEKTSMIKRPVIEDGNFLYFGFDADVYAAHFLK